MTLKNEVEAFAIHETHLKKLDDFGLPEWLAADQETRDSKVEFARKIAD